MSEMNEIVIQKNNDFVSVYNKSYRLAAAVFMISNVIDENEQLKTKIKNLSLNLVSVSVNLKDISFLDAKKIIVELEKNSLELMSMLDIASISGLISKMNASVLREEFQLFVLELGKFLEKLENNRVISVKGVFEASIDTSEKINVLERLEKKERLNNLENGKNHNHKRKDLRKNTILEFIKGHNSASIKDIMPNIIGCSEKTIQRELIHLIKDKKIIKTGERRWSKYTIA